MIRRPPRSTRTDTLCHYTTLFRSKLATATLPSAWVSPLVKLARTTPSLSTVTLSSRPEGKPSCVNDMMENGSEYWVVAVPRSEEHTSELQSLMRISYAVFCLKKKKKRMKRLQHNIAINT